MSCLLIASRRLESPERLERARLVSRRVEHRIRVLGVEWTTMVREDPAETAVCEAAR